MVLESSIDYGYEFIAAYLPPSLPAALHQFQSAIRSISSNPSQLVPILLSLLTIYAAILSLWIAMRTTFRLVWFTLKWGVVFATLGVLISGYNNLGKPGATNAGLETVGRVGRGAVGMGIRGIDWWSGGVAEAEPNRLLRLRKSQGGRSASGRPRRWSFDSNDAEGELERSGSGGDPIKTFQDTVLSFLGDGGPSVNEKRTGSKKAKSNKGEKLKKKSKENQSNDSAVGSAYRMARNLWS